MLETGLILGGIYSLERQLGKGAMGEVWLAEHLLLNQPRAIKIMLGTLDHSPSARERFIHGEARNALRLEQHLNIVRIYELSLHDETPYIVMEYVQGGPFGANLREMLKAKGRLNLEQTADLLMQLGSALEAAHRQGLIHRDVKPANLLLDTKGQIKLSDFGLTKDLQAEVELTGTGYSMGTPTYMAPEQASGHADYRSDIYAMGVVLYHMLTGRPPFLGTYQELLIQHAVKPPTPPQEFDPTISPDISNVVLKALAKAPEDRYQSAMELARAFHRLILTGDFPSNSITLSASPGDHFEEDTSILACPYRGLFAFQENDAPYFFGREVFTERILARLQERPLVAMVGPSGSGKSSAIQAGLIPVLRYQNTWRIVSFRPGSQPFQNLATALLPLLEINLNEVDRLVETKKLIRALQQQDISLVEVIGRIRQKHGGAKLLVVVDQFEELYTLCHDDQERQQFLDELLSINHPNAVQQDQFLFNLILTLRADFFGYALSYRPLADVLQQSQQNLGPMTHEELQDAIEGPAKKLEVRIEKGLTERILEAVSNRPGDLPLLEFALTLLWDKQKGRTLTHTAYDEIGGVEKALARYAEEIYNQLGTEDQKRTHQVLIQLVRPGDGTADTRRVATRAEIGEENWPLVAKLADARLVVSGRDEANAIETVEVVHEALIRHWHRLQEWLSADRAFRLWQERLRTLLRQWEINQQDEGALLRGLVLSEAEGWFLQRQPNLSQRECNFIQTSLKLREQEKQNQEERRQKELQDAHHLVAAERKAATWLRWVIAVLLIGVLGISIMAALALSQSSEADNQRNPALKAQANAETLQKQAEEQRNNAEKQRQIALSRQLAVQAHGRIGDQLDLALLLSLEANRISDTQEAKTSLPESLEYSPELSTFLHGHPSVVGSLAFSPDGKKLISGDYEKNLFLWDLTRPTATPQMLEGHNQAIVSVAFSPDGKTVASAGDEKTILLWDISASKPVSKTLSGHQDVVRSLAFSPDGKMLASAGDDKQILLWDLSTANPVLKQTLTSSSSQEINSIAFSPDGKRLASGGKDTTVVLWDLAGPTPAVKQTLRGHNDAVRAVSFSPDGKQLASAGADTSIMLWDVASDNGVLKQTLKGHTASVSSIAFSPDGKTLASVGDDTNVILWNLEEAKPAGRFLKGHSALIHAVDFSPDGKTMATGGADREIILWNISSARPLSQNLAGHTGDVNSAIFSPDGKLLASASDDKTVLVWDLTKTVPTVLQTLQGHSDGVRMAVFSPDGKQLASAGFDKNVILWNLSSATPVSRTLSGHTGGIFGLAFSPDGKVLASGSGDKTIRLWDLTKAEPTSLVLNGHSGLVNFLAFSSDGKRLATAGDDKTVIVWDLTLANPAALYTLKGHQDSVDGVAFSPDGKLLVTGSEDKTVIDWDLTGPTPVIKDTLKAHSRAVYRVAFSSDGKVLTTSGEDKTIILWNMTGPHPTIQAILSRPAPVGSLNFTSDGKALASASGGLITLLWDLDQSHWQTQACQVANRNLSQEEWQQYLGEEPYHKTCANLP